MLSIWISQILILQFLRVIPLRTRLLVRNMALRRRLTPKVLDSVNHDLALRLEDNSRVRHLRRAIRKLGVSCRVSNPSLIRVDGIFDINPK